MAQITIVNIGRRSAVVKRPNLRLPDGAVLSLHGADGAQEFPKRLEDGDMAQIRIELKSIANALKQSQHFGVLELVPSCEDTAGHIYEGEAKEFNTKEWS